MHYGPLSHRLQLHYISSAHPRFPTSFLPFFYTQSAESDNPPFPRKDRREGLARFSAKYGISAREQDVLQLITKGSIRRQSARPCIFENTTKTHVRQLLRKTETHNRIALTAPFLKWKRGNRKASVGAMTN